MDFYDMLTERMYSQKARERLIEVFENETPSHPQKLWFVGFLLNVVKLSPDEVKEITCNQSAWVDKNHHMHDLQVNSVVKSIDEWKRSHPEIKIDGDVKIVKKWTPPKYEQKVIPANERLKRFVKNVEKPRRMNTFCMLTVCKCLDKGQARIECYNEDTCKQCSLRR